MMNSLKIMSSALVLALLLVSAVVAEDKGGKENTETHQNQDGSWTGTTTYKDGSKKVTESDKDHHTTKETKYDAKGNKTEESDWAWNDKEKTDVMRRRRIYAHTDEQGHSILESETEYDENGVVLKEKVWEEGYIIVDTYFAGKRIKREKIVDGKVVKTEHFDKDGNLVQNSMAQPPASPVIPRGAAPDNRATAQLVGLVYDKDTRPGDQVTVSITTDPKDYQDIPALGVIEMEVPGAVGSTAQASLQGMVVDLGDGRKQSANQPLTIKIAQNVTAIPVTISQQGSATPIAQVRVPIAQGASPIAVTNTGKASDFSTPPAVQNVSFIRGPLSGDGDVTHIAVDNRPATIVAGTPRSAFFNLPAETTPGEHTLTLQDGDRAASATIVELGLIMQAGQLQLQRGQSTNYTATVLLGPLPDSVWQRGGSSPELVNASQYSHAPGFKVPQAGEPAAVLFRIENASRDTITIKPSQQEVITRVLHQQDFKNGQFLETGTIQSKKSGGFVINGTAQTFFAPISCGELMQTTAPGAPPVLFVPPAGATLATSKFKGKGGDGFKDTYERTFGDKDLKICEKANCGDPQEIKEGKSKGFMYCKEDNKCGGTKCPQASCHLFWAWIDGAKGPGGKERKEDNEKWTQFGSDPTKGLKDGTGIGKDNAIPRDADHAYACVCK